jgi:hypothetical protein
MYGSVDPTRDPAYVPFAERPPDTRAVRAAFANEVGSLMDELARAADRTRHKVITIHDRDNISLPLAVYDAPRA